MKLNLYIKIDKYVLWSIFIFMILNFIDFLITIFMLQTGNFSELNPIANYFFQYNYFLAFAFNIFYIIFIILFTFEIGKLIYIKIEKGKYNSKIRFKHFLALNITFSIIQLGVIAHNIFIVVF